MMTVRPGERMTVSRWRMAVMKMGVVPVRMPISVDVRDCIVDRLFCGRHPGMRMRHHNRQLIDEQCKDQPTRSDRTEHRRSPKDRGPPDHRPDLSHT